VCGLEEAFTTVPLLTTIENSDNSADPEIEL